MPSRQQKTQSGVDAGWPTAAVPPADNNSIEDPPSLPNLDCDDRGGSSNGSANPHSRAEAQRWTFYSSCMSPPAELPNPANHTPKIGYGSGTVWYKRKDPGFNRELVEAIKAAIRLGYRHLDSAEVYSTEKELGIAIKESGVPRAEFFVTTKVWRGIDDVPGALEASLQRLGLDYVDLYLIHTPFDAESDAQLQLAWDKLEILKQSGKARSIGVSNFYSKHLNVILRNAKIKPAINQIEFHTYLQNPQFRELQELQKKHDIAFAAYGSIAPLTKASPGPVDEVVQRLSAKYNVGEEAILLRWVMEQGIAAITTSGKESRLTDYLGATEFSLTPDEVSEISAEGEKKHYRGYWTTRFHDGGSVVRRSRKLDR